MRMNLSETPRRKIPELMTTVARRVFPLVLGVWLNVALWVTNNCNWNSISPPWRGLFQEIELMGGLRAYVAGKKVWFRWNIQISVLRPPLLRHLSSENPLFQQIHLAAICCGEIECVGFLDFLFSRILWTYAIIRATGNCGTALLDNLSRNPTANVRAYFRNRNKLVDTVSHLFNNETSGDLWR
jgi:hypothetical protein